MYLRQVAHHFLQASVESFFACIAFIVYCLSPIFKPIFAVILSVADIEINGNREWDIQVNDDRFYGQVAARGVCGLCDSYIYGHFDARDLEKTFSKLLDAGGFLFSIERYHPYRLLKYGVHKYVDALTPELVKNAINPHYDKTADVLRDLFDANANYSAMLMYDVDQVVEATQDELQEMLDDAAFRSRDNIAKKLHLEPGMKVLDIGCGFGGLAKHMAERYKVEVTGVTICKAMAARAMEVCSGLPVKIILDDYRSITGQFDRIVSIEMIEHVGENHLKEYFQHVSRWLAKDGLFLLQTHFMTEPNYPSYSPIWEMCLDMHCYFSRLEEIVFAAKGSVMVQDVENLGYCFGVTCKAGLKKLRLDKQLRAKIGEIEYRRLELYASLATAGALCGRHACYQIAFSKNGLRYAYQRR